MPGQQRGHRNNVSQRKQQRELWLCACGHPMTLACNLPHSVGKQTHIEVAAGFASRAGAYSPGSVTALWLLSYTLPTSQTEPDGWQTQSRAFCMCAPSPLPSSVLQPALCVSVYMKWSMLLALLPSLSSQLKKRALDQLHLVKSKPQRSPEQPAQQLWLEPCLGELLPLCLHYHSWRPCCPLWAPKGCWHLGCLSLYAQDPSYKSANRILGSLGIFKAPAPFPWFSGAFHCFCGSWGHPTFSGE